MKLTDDLTNSTLGWVKRELDATLKLARESLEAHVEAPGEGEELKRCAGYIHQVQGTLRMVELHGAALVAEEMERLANTCLAAEVEEPEESYGVLMRGIMQLPDYLDRLASGYRDIPIVLLSLLNDLRAARGGDILSESTFFSPALDVSLAEAPQSDTPVGPDELLETAKKLRLAYQGSLVRWFRNRDVSQAQARMSQVLRELTETTSVVPARRMWWVAGAVLDGLAEGRVQSSPTVKKLAGHVDREIKRLFENGEEDFEKNPPDDLTRTLLYYVAYAPTRTPYMEQVNEAFGLHEWIPQDAELEHAEGTLSGHNRELLVTVSSAIKEDLLRVKEAFDLYLRAGEHDPATLREQTDDLGRIADTLGMLGLAEQRNQVQTHQEALAAMATGEQEVDEGTLMETASALLYVEASLDDHIETLGAFDEMEAARAGTSKQGGIELPYSEMQRINRTLLEEATRNLNQAKDCIVRFIDSPWDHETLQTIPNLTTEVIGALKILEQEEAADVLRGIRRYLNRRLVEAHSVPPAEELDTLADALESLEYYLGGLADHRPGTGRALMLSQQRAAELDFAETAETLEQDQTPAQPGSVEEEEPEESPVDVVDMSPSAPEAAYDAPVSGDEIDDEIREVFVEEVGEELEGLRELYPEWKSDPEETEQLTHIRRSFHTLKGSGRLVGALKIGEFSWKVENMLNRVLEGNREATPAVFALMDEVIETALPQLHTELKGEGPPECDIEAIKRTADELAEGEEPQPEDEVEADASAEAAVESSDDTGEAAAPEEPPEETDSVAVEAGAQADDRELDEAAGPAIEEPDGQQAFEGETEREWSVTETKEAGPGDDEPSEAGFEFDLPVGEGIDLDLESEPDTGRQEDTEAPAVEGVAPSGGDDEPAVSDEESGEAGERVDLEADEADGEAEESGIDPALYEVFHAEATTHLRAIDNFLDRARANPEQTPVDDDLTGPVHTLNGATGMAGIAHLDELTDAMERYAQNLKATGSGFSQQGFWVFESAFQTTEVIVEEAGRPQPDYPPVDTLSSRLRELAREAGAAPVEGADTSEEPGAVPEPEAFSVDNTEAEDIGETEEPADTEAGLDVPAGAFVDEEPESEEAAGSEAEPVAESGTEPEAGVDEEPDPELVEVFLEEGMEILDASDAYMQRWRADREDREPVAALQRDLHTLKGGARMAGLTGLGDLGHGLESVFEAVNERRVAPSDETLDRIEHALDHLHDDMDSIGSGKKVPYPSRMIESINALLEAEPEADVDAEPGAEAEVGADTETSDEAEAEPGTDAVEAPAEIEPAAPAAFTRERVESVQQADRRPGRGEPQEAVRVSADLLDNLVNYAGEISIYRSRLDQQVGAIRFNLVEFAQTVTRLREQLRKLEIETESQILSRLQREGVIPEDETVDLEQFDPLELDRFSEMQQYSRALAESVSDLVNIEDILSDLTRESETLLLQQSRINSDLQEGLMRTRMVPFSSQESRLRRVLRRTARDLNKRARLEVDGAEGEMDRTVLERMTAPLEHMLRNALAHGIESPEDRRAAGKPEEGNIQLSVRREASEVIIEVVDDGRGIDLQAVRETAIERGLVREDADLTEQDILSFIIETGFSTAGEVSQVAGRGVGMDVVHAEIKQLSGTMDINSRSGEGTRFTIRLPFTLAVTQSLMIRVGDENFAVPLSGIEGVVRVEREEFDSLIAMGEEARLTYGGEEYEVQDLAVLLGKDVQHPRDQAFVPVLIVRTGDRRAAVRVDELIGSSEVVVKSVGPQLSTVPGIFGATILGDGSVVLILDLLPLIRRGTALHLLTEEMESAREEVEEELRPTIMVVDDSITMRKVASRMLERNDMDVVTAKDGVDAVAQLQEKLPDVMLLDIEMPRMDGYELATHIRNDSRLKELPIIMVTSRTGTKHRERAENLGVNKYVGKPYQEADLLAEINALLEDQNVA